MLVGVDEAGRGPLAGPVCAAAVILHEQQPIAGLADSKTLSAKRRDALAPVIKSDSRAWGIGWASVQEIDDIDILRATFMAMARAVQDCLTRLCSTQPEIARLGSAELLASLRVQVDGNRSPGTFQGPWHWPYLTETIVKGDQKVACISAASILAKTARDEEMQRLDMLHPHYGFAQHAGYGTAAHLQALKQHGPCEFHRKTFAPVARLLGQGSLHESDQ
ncbi:MAG: ribonuclease HII [Burkholderiaceae bacterium]|nr:ribonuclease HII [Burkholderiaceae bacterium]